MFDADKKSSPAIVKEQAEGILQSSVFSELLKNTPNVLMILNSQRQVVYLNRHPVPASDAISDHPLGERPGECLGCINIAKGELGCGSTEFCRVCGFNAAITASETGKNGQDECNIALKNGASLTLSVSTKPFEYNNETYIFCALEDISEKKRRQMLESIFLHDILNTAAILGGLSEAYTDIPDEQIRSMLREVSTNISDEVQAYRLISTAETQTLRTNYSEVEIGEIVNEVVRSLGNMRKFQNRSFSVNTTSGTIVTERSLLRSVLVNMVKNALEAADQNDVIYIQAHFNEKSNRALFSVQNPQTIPRKDQLKLFQKSFSTKGRGRGWGTYSIKILTEKYLKGTVTFQSGNGTGTVFTITIPSLE